MKSLIVLLLSTSVAFADATLTLSLTGAGAANTSKTLIVSDADGVRILTWAKDAYGPVVVPPASSDPAVCVAPLPAQCLSTTRALTNKEAMDAAFGGLINGILANVKNNDSSKASRAASDAVTPVTPK